MNKLVVLLCVGLARSSFGHAPAATNILATEPGISAIAAAPGVYLASAAPAYRIASAPAYRIAPAPAHAAAYTAPAVASAPVVAAVPAIALAPAARLATPAAIQTTSYALQRNVHYASQPVVTGYSASVVKPNFGSLATPLNTVSQQAVLAAGRQVQTITPQVTRVEPEVSLQQVPVDVPVPTPVVSEVEIRTPVVQGAPVVAAPAVAAVAHGPVAVAQAPVAVAAAPAAVADAPAAVADDLPTIVAARSAAWGSHAVLPLGARIAQGLHLAH